MTLIESAPAPLARVVGEEVGGICADHHRARGTRLLTGAHVTAIEGSAGGCRITLADGRRIEGDVVVVGVGGYPEVDWLAGSGLAVGDGLACDSFLNAGHPDVYAAGDIVRWPNSLLGVTMRSEQWTNAIEQARRAAGNLLAGNGGGSPHGGSGYFWSDQYGSRLQSAGTCEADEVRIVHGDPASFEFTALYRRGDRLCGAVAMNQGGPFVRSKLLIERGASWESALSSVESGGLAA